MKPKLTYHRDHQELRRLELQMLTPQERQGKRPDQVEFSAIVVILSLIAGLAFGATVALYQWGSDMDGIRVEGISVRCWH